VRRRLKGRRRSKGRLLWPRGGRPRAPRQLLSLLRRRRGHLLRRGPRKCQREGRKKRKERGSKEKGEAQGEEGEMGKGLRKAVYQG